MITEKEVFRIGFLLKPHGVKGEISMSFLDSVVEELDAPYLVCLVDGIFVPFFVESVRNKGDRTVLIKFQGINSIEQARRFQGIRVFVPIQYASQEIGQNLTWESFIGFQVIDSKSGLLGNIEAVDTSTLNVIFFVAGLDKEIIIPANEEWIDNIDTQEKIINFSLPEGIVDLN